MGTYTYTGPTYDLPPGMGLAAREPSYTPGRECDVLGAKHITLECTYTYVYVYRVYVHVYRVYVYVDGVYVYLYGEYITRSVAGDAAGKVHLRTLMIYELGFNQN